MILAENRVTHYKIFVAADAAPSHIHAAEDKDTLRRVRILRLSTRYALLCRMPMDDPRRESGWNDFYRDVTEAGIDTFYWRQMPDRALDSCAGATCASAKPEPLSAIRDQRSTLKRDIYYRERFFRGSRFQPRRSTWTRSN